MRGQPCPSPWGSPLAVVPGADATWVHAAPPASVAPPGWAYIPVLLHAAPAAADALYDGLAPGPGPRPEPQRQPDPEPGPSPVTFPGHVLLRRVRDSCGHAAWQRYLPENFHERAEPLLRRPAVEGEPVAGAESTEDLEPEGAAEPESPTADEKSAAQLRIVAALTGQELARIPAGPLSTVASLKAQIMAVTGIPAHEQKLMLAGSQTVLPDARKLHDLHGGAELQLVRSPTGKASVAGITGNVMALALHRAGSRSLQEAFEKASPAECAKWAKEMQGHVWELLRCPYGNHALQRCVVAVAPGHEGLQFVVEELREQGDQSVRIAARHRFGCRVLQRLLEHGQPGIIRSLVEALLADAKALCRHRFANYVMQHLLEYGDDVERTHMLVVLKDFAESLGENLDIYVCDVFMKAMGACAPQEKLELAQAIAAQPRFLVALACSRHGNLAVKSMLQLRPWCQELEEARRLLAAEESRSAALSASRHGRVVLRYVADLASGDVL